MSVKMDNITDDQWSVWNRWAEGPVSHTVSFNSINPRYPHIVGATAPWNRICNRKRTTTSWTAIHALHPNQDSTTKVWSKLYYPPFNLHNKTGGNSSQITTGIWQTSHNHASLFVTLWTKFLCVSPTSSQELSKCCAISCTVSPSLLIGAHLRHFIWNAICLFPGNNSRAWDFCSRGSTQHAQQISRSKGAI